MSMEQGNEQQEYRERLLAAAEKLMLQVGLSEINTEVLRQEAGLSKEVFNDIFDNLMETGTPVLQRLLLRFEAEANAEPTLPGKLELFMVRAIRLMSENGLPIIRAWIRGALNMEQTSGMTVVFTFWDILGRFFERSLEEGLLVDDTPVKNFVNTLSAEFFGTLFCWCIMNGQAIDPEHTIHNYCQRDLPVLLNPYYAASAG